jgi:hypothetical protein
MSECAALHAGLSDDDDEGRIWGIGEGRRLYLEGGYVIMHLFFFSFFYV